MIMIMMMRLLRQHQRYHRRRNNYRKGSGISFLGRLHQSNRLITALGHLVNTKKSSTGKKPVPTVHISSERITLASAMIQSKHGWSLNR